MVVRICSGPFSHNADQCFVNRDEKQCQFDQGACPLGKELFFDCYDNRTAKVTEFIAGCLVMRIGLFKKL